MKRLMFATAAMIAGICVADVESANIVGYQTQQQKEARMNSLLLVAPGFVHVDNEKITSEIIVPNQAAPHVDWDAEDYIDAAIWKADAPSLQIPDGSGGYQELWYLEDAETDDGDFIRSWADPEGMAAVRDIDIGVGCWVRGKKDTPTVFTFSGAVDSQAAETISRETPINFELVANPFPITVSTDDVTWNIDAVDHVDWDAEDYIDAAIWKGGAAEIQIPDGNGGYQELWYLTDAETDDGDFINGWADAEGMAASREIPAGWGFWIRRCNAEGKSSAWSFTVAR